MRTKMSSLAVNSAVFNSIISGTSIFCCLCYNIVEENAIKIIDEVNLNSNNVSVQLSRILSTVLGGEFLESLPDVDTVCRQCTQSAINSYLFIKLCKDKHHYISQAVTHLLTSFNNTSEHIGKINTIFVSLNNKDFTTTNYYDKKRRVVTRTAAYKRYQAITNPENGNRKSRYLNETDVAELDYDDFYPVIHKKKTKKVIRTCDMLYDKKDPSNVKCKECFNKYCSLAKLRVHYLRIHAPKVLNCPDCHRSFASLTLLQQHRIYTHVPVSCSICGKDYSNRHSLKEHMQNHKDGDSECPHCGKIYKNKKMVKRHIELSRCTKMGKNLACNLCLKQFANEESLLLHANTHTELGTKMVKITHRKIPTYDMVHDKNDKSCIKCKGCLKNFMSHKNLRDHYIRAHAPKVYKCPECPRSFGSVAHVKEHQRNSHCAGICNICGKQYSNRNSLKGHLATHKEKIVCQNCGRAYKNEKALNRHIEQNLCGLLRSKPTLKDYICDYCSKGFTQRCSIVSHIKLEHENGKAHVCMWCNKRYNCQSRLRVHIVTHTQEKNFTCEVCGGKFVTKESLLYHTRIHTGERPYPCQHCDNRFLSASRLNEHIHRRHMSATFECDICHRKFKFRSLLKKHRTRHFKPNSKLFSEPKSSLKKESSYVCS